MPQGPVHETQFCTRRQRGEPQACPVAAAAATAAAATGAPAAHLPPPRSHASHTLVPTQVLEGVEVIEGNLPEELEGTYVRTGERGQAAPRCAAFCLLPHVEELSAAQRPLLPPRCSLVVHLHINRAKCSPELLLRRRIPVAHLHTNHVPMQGPTPSLRQWGATIGG